MYDTDTHFNFTDAAIIWGGLVSSLILILLSQDTFTSVYQLTNFKAPNPLSQPAIISVPLSVITLVVVSLMTRNKNISN